MQGKSRGNHPYSGHVGMVTNELSAAKPGADSTFVDENGNAAITVAKRKGHNKIVGEALLGDSELFWVKKLLISILASLICSYSSLALKL